MAPGFMQDDDYVGLPTPDINELHLSGQHLDAGMTVIRPWDRSLDDLALEGAALLELHEWARSDSESLCAIKPEPDPELEKILDSSILEAFPSPRASSASSRSPVPQPPLSALRVDIPECVILTPRSCFEPFEPPVGVPLLSERSAIKLLSHAWDEMEEKQSPENMYFHLNDFSIYCDSSRFPEEMRSLHHLDTKVGSSCFFLDGILSIDGKSAYIKRMPIASVPIEGYGAECHSIKDGVWVQSAVNSNNKLYYKLGQPTKEYARFFYPFLWVANMAKHFVDYLEAMSNSRRKVTIADFRSNFASWAAKTHQGASDFADWFHQHPSRDFRSSVVANIAFLHKEAIGILGQQRTYHHTIWAEIWSFTRYPEPTAPISLQTVVTPYIYECFRHLPFGDRLEVVQLSPGAEQCRNKLIQERRMELAVTPHNADKSVSTASEQLIKEIRPGDTISTHRDEVESGTQWQREVSKGFADVDRWFALVQRVHVKKDGTRNFDVIWYYRPVDTLCGLMLHPWNNELFLSDHCSCPERSKIDEGEILGIHSVEFGGNSSTTSEFFCRQTYLSEQRRWITLRDDHVRCKHNQSIPRQKDPKFRVGDTYLLHLDSPSSLSEPCEFVASFREEGRKFHRFRRLFRRKQTAPDARPNELIYSEQFVEVKKTRVLSRCHVRCFFPDDTILTPYDRDGVGNFFYITHEEKFIDGRLRCVALSKAPSSLQQSFDPHEKIPKLRGMDLFCGGGNFGRGLEDGGAVEMKWANDYDSKAMHTYMANVKDPKTFHPFLGSIDDLQRLAIQGQFANNVPKIGDVDFISGGSPCPGFSRLTNDKTTVQQRKNQSLVAAFASYVDLYRPKFGLLENVPGIVHKKADRNQDVFSQLICALVGLGYQTQFFFLDASSCGSAQRRSRVFIIFAAPGLELPQKPVQTHSHPPMTKTIGIGWLPTGQHMAVREMPIATPFKHVTAEEVTADLPPIYDAKPDICVPFPDHRVSVGLTRSLRTRIRLIPKRPWGMSFAQAWYGEDREKPGSGIMTLAERALFPNHEVAMGNGRVPFQVQNNSKAFSRLFPNRLLETIVTTQNAGDAKNGRQVHWAQDRVLTVMEARRAQGLRDEEVLLGNPRAQYKIVGNSVAREVAVALGGVIRIAWEASLKAEDGKTQGVTRVADEGTSVATPFTTQQAAPTLEKAVSHKRSRASSISEGLEMAYCRPSKQAKQEVMGIEEVRG